MAGDSRAPSPRGDAKNEGQGAAPSETVFLGKTATHCPLSEILVRLYQMYSSALLWPVHRELGAQHLTEQIEKGKEGSWGGGARS